MIWPNAKPMVSDDFLKKKKEDSHTPPPRNTYIQRVT